ncbi:MAG: type II toxin-antitoxin system HicA family toxin [Nitrosomonas sp.]|nr:type II toxin-antitoxin system HicA family toxin [Nitrosomonas sp.]MDP1950283.1 type II toxin-antitoxin system HicA family toxin [Nitrosomonas sp.]
MKKKKLLQKILTATNNIRFTEIVTCVESFGFKPDRVHGSHHVFIHPAIPELLNLQNVKGKAKSYQIKQFLILVEKHNLQLSD